MSHNSDKTASDKLGAIVLGLVKFQDYNRDLFKDLFIVQVIS